ncbi:MAG: neutral/alkaline non-lysosomal ceramidase N-terminal domain-containing protein [Acidobacteria bacterium]|nr:neutral/alkaline non-lysosomal ceramidase N-terminal domain-containing protein [Acidobacteriota bacterium]MBI3423667.1 neutral/alkaline non-lysosomal ceramidase N-terminal domain-containing protein [Acidobacteriota bacterium]
MARWMIAIVCLFVLLCLVLNAERTAAKDELKVGVAAVAVTPFGQNQAWDGTVTASGVWGETFTDQNGNGVWDSGEPFVDDPGNTELDASSKNKYDGIYLAGFGNKRLATGKHDDLWARTIVLEYGTTKLAIVAVDFIGYYSEAKYYGLNHVRKYLDPKLGIHTIGDILIASTHSHEGPDTIGAWGHGALNDGKYPKYLRFVDQQIARSIQLAAAKLEPARVKLGQTDAQKSPGVAGMQTRTGGRPPHFFDEELRVLQFVGTRGARKDKAIATLVNWNTHPESMEDKNTVLTSDFCHSIREEVEKRFGGTALYVNGAIGAAEIIGDTNRKTNDRSTFDGKQYDLPAIFGKTDLMFERTMAIGREVAKATIAALENGEWSKTNALEVRQADLQVPMDNPAYLMASKIGVLDTMEIPSDEQLKAGALPQAKTTLYAIRLGDAQLVTTPGELFPEVFYGVAKYRRSDCPAADNGAPPEPSIREAMTAKYRFMLGLCPDEFGYIVPRYDWQREPLDMQKLDFKRAIDPCKAKGVPNHYHETNSASSVLAPASACVTVALLTGKVPNVAACQGVAQYSAYVRELGDTSSKR